MRMLFTTVALSVALATPALAQTADRAPEQLVKYQPRASDSNAYASVTPRPGRSINRRNVYGPHGYVGSDPDPRVRDQLRRDPTQGD